MVLGFLEKANFFESIGSFVCFIYICIIQNKIFDNIYYTMHIHIFNLYSNLCLYSEHLQKMLILHNLLKNVKKKNVKEYFVVTLHLQYV